MTEKELKEGILKIKNSISKIEARRKYNLICEKAHEDYMSLMLEAHEKFKEIADPSWEAYKKIVKLAEKELDEWKSVKRSKNA